MTIWQGMEYKIGKNLEIKERGNRKSFRQRVLRDCAIYTETRPITMKNKKWTGTITVKTEKQIWELGNFIKGNAKLKAFCINEWRNQRRTNKKDTSKSDICTVSCMVNEDIDVLK